MPQKPDTVAALPTRLLVLDVDGTVTNSRHEVTAATCEAVARIRAAGIRVVLATGRRYRDTLPVAARLGISGPLITASGALVKRTTDHATLARAEFGPGVLAGVVAEIVAAGHEREVAVAAPVPTASPRASIFIAEVSPLAQHKAAMKALCRARSSPA